VGEVDPLLFINMRFLLAALVVLAYLLAARRPIRRLVSGKILWILGITNGLGFVMEIFGLNFTTATNASLLVNVNVVFMAIFSALLLGERIRPRAKVGIVIGLVGVFLITTGGDITTIFGGTVMGDMIIFAGGVVWAYSMIYNKKAATQLRMTAMEVTESMTLTSALTVLPFLAFSSFSFSPTPIALASVAYTAVFCTIVAFFLFYRSLRVLTVVNTGVIMLLEIVVAILVSSAFLGEALPPVGMAGGALIGLAIFLVA
ncbi:MAG TPA: EamA family transporter, partial [Candidatus Methanomethylicus sp.]|nr:EamA family transporter [Candidatus Methanomethylicus sp.]